MFDPLVVPVNDPAARELFETCTRGFSDRFGDRLLTFDRATATPLELLRFKVEFGASGAFETGLRERIAHTQVQDPAIAPARAVERWDGALLLVSRHVAGRRLSEVMSEEQGPAFALDFICQVVPALAALAESNHKFAHGAMTLDRVVVGRDGRFTIMEHPLGAAVEGLGWPSARLQSELGLVVPETRKSSHFDSRIDAIQIGFVALSLLLGRRADAVSYPANVSRLLDESADAKEGGSWAASRLRSWIERALQVGPRPLETIQDALNSLGELPSAMDFHRREQTPAAETQAPKQETRLKQVVPAKPYVPPPAPPAPAIPPATPTLTATPTSTAAPTRTAVPTSPATPTPAAPPMSTATPLVPQQTRTAAAAPAPPQAVAAPPIPTATPTHAAAPKPSAPPTKAAAPMPTAPPTRTATPASTAPIAPAKKVEPWPAVASTNTPTAPSTEVARPPVAAAPLVSPKPSTTPTSKKSSRLSVGSWALVAVSAVALVEGVVLGGQWLFKSKPPVTEPARPASVATVPPASPGVPVTKITAPPPAPAAETAPPRREIPPAAPERPAAEAAVAAHRFGGMTIVSPLELQVFEGGTRIGASGAPIAVMEGVHTVDLVNDAIGYRSRETITVKGGELASRTVATPNGKLSINAVPWAEVLIDGTSAGQTPLANLSIPVGEHQITFRHPQFGEQRQTALVKADGITRLSANMQR